MALAIDTLNIYSRLKATGLSEESAQGIAEIFRETVEENLASKNDFHHLFHNFHYSLVVFGMRPINSYNPNGL